MHFRLKLCAIIISFSNVIMSSSDKTAVQQSPDENEAIMEVQEPKDVGKPRFVTCLKI